MSPVVIFAALAAAFLTRPAAFLFLWFPYVKTGERSLRTIAFSTLGFFLVLIDNSASFIINTHFRIHIPRAILVSISFFFKYWHIAPLAKTALVAPLAFAASLLFSSIIRRIPAMGTVFKKMAQDGMNTE